jgi:long-chain acyl-CoA synthetase
MTARFKGICPYVGEYIVFGEGRPYCVALVGLDSEAITEWADKHGLAGKSFVEIARHEKTRELIGGYIDALNEELNRREQVKKFAIIDRELSIEAGDLTPSLKLRRKVVIANFADQFGRSTSNSGSGSRVPLNIAGEPGLADSPGPVDHAVRRT